MGKDSIHIGIDLGGTKTEIIALDPGGETLFRKRVSSPQNSYPATIEMLANLVAECENRLHNECSIGIGTPGSVNQLSGLLQNSNSTWLNNKPFKADLQQRLGKTIAIANDANCFTLSEATDGAAADCEVVFGVIIGTGTGGGVVVNKRVISGRNGLAGEWGHNPLPWPRSDEVPGNSCYCGKRGCIETFLSGPGISRDFQNRTGKLSKAENIIALARQGDEVAVACMDDYYERMAKSLAHIINILDPDAIVLGGGLSNIQELYNEIPKRWHRYVFSQGFDTPLLQARFGDASGVRGAAWLNSRVD
ncbi:MAG: ROK family protein [Gammaproteobacteria bacterium]|nr:ROK family protein [Gammaproteobacteria bacterium]